MQVIIKSSRQGGANSAHLRKVGDARAHHPLQAAEVPEEGATLDGPEPGHHLEHRLVITPGALPAMAGNREAMCLIAYALDEA